MLVSFNWLRDYVDLSPDPYAVAHLLTMAGSEVERITKVGEGLAGVVVGEITSLTRHPRADKLSLLTVTTGSRSYAIVCGAANLTPGDKVPLALEGTHLPSGITITPVKIRGELSQGMLCSEAELGLGTDTSGIMILPPEVSIGHSLSSALALEDYILEINITPNRPDCLSIIGIAREIAALTHTSIHLPPLSLKEAGTEVAQLTSVTIHDPDLCPRYTARIISQVTVGSSPLWLRRRLESCGMRSINNVVDVTNYLLLEMGQPLHAFDLHRLAQQKIMVSRSSPGSTFITLDGKERLLPPDALMICDGAQPIALGGIMGGLNSEVSDTTTTILLESAYFTPSGILRTSKTMGIRTESSQRFEKGVDPDSITTALHRAAQLIATLAGGTVNPGYIDNYPTPLVPPPPITLSAQRTTTLLGIPLTKDTMKQHLRDLHFSVHDLNEDQVAVTPPSFRVDIKEEVDLIEEIARLAGYETIAASLPPILSCPQKRDPARVLEKTIKDCFTHQGYYEIITYSFIAPDELTALNFPPQDTHLSALTLLNPLNEEQSVMRTTLIPGLLSAVRKNCNQKNLNLKLFEVGTVFHPHAPGTLPGEQKMLAAVASGEYQEEGWNVEKRAVDFFDLKGVVESLLDALHITTYSFHPYQDCPYLHPLKALQLVIHQEPAGVFGELHPQLQERLQLPHPLYLLEMPLAPLRTFFSEYHPFRALPKYPAVYRDIALVVDDTISAQRIYATIDKLKNKFIEEITIFDYYKGTPIPPGKKSVAYRLKYQAYDRTLTDKEVNDHFEALLKMLYQELGAEIRQ